MINFILIGIILLVLGCAIGYIREEKRKGRKCIGCPHSGQCAGSCGCQGNQ